MGFMRIWVYEIFVNMRFFTIPKLINFTSNTFFRKSLLKSTSSLKYGLALTKETIF